MQLAWNIKGDGHRAETTVWNRYHRVTYYWLWGLTSWRWPFDRCGEYFVGSHVLFLRAFFHIVIIWLAKLTASETAAAAATAAMTEKEKVKTAAATSAVNTFGLLWFGIIQWEQRIDLAAVLAKAPVITCPVAADGISIHLTILHKWTLNLIDPFHQFCL